MGVIRVLPEAVANTIAAGEVIERPASIVKELVENALDAGATSLDVEIRHGGKSLIQISDDGCGMSADDVPLAFERYATSKLSDADDLLRLRSLGFRGEALPSIAAVCRVRLVTARPEDASGTQIQIEGGRRVLLTRCPPRQGTLVEVRDLFFNTPARRKFLRADPTETGHVIAACTSLALSHWRVRFRLASPARALLDLPPAQTFLERARAVFGHDAAPDLLAVDGAWPGGRVSGVIGKPSLARANRSGQRFFINGRWVRAFSLSTALQEGFAGRLMHGQYPLAALLFELDPQLVDVNVHPAKQEVRLSDDRALRSALAALIAARLHEEPDLAPRFRLVRPSASSAHPANPAEAPQPVRLDRPATAEDPQPRVAEAAAPYEVSPALALAQDDGPADRFQVTHILGQLHGTFIVAETSEGFLLADQHAAHERVMFETLRKQLDAGRPECQPLLTESVLELAPQHWEAAEASLEWLRGIGFDVEVFDERALLIRGLPAALGAQDPAAVLRRFFEEREADALRPGLARAAENLAALIACKRRSVRAHDPLAPEAMRSLLAQLSQCEQPFTCPHGRPTVLTHATAELLRHFKRT